MTSPELQRAFATVTEAVRKALAARQNDFVLIYGQVEQVEERSECGADPCCGRYKKGCIFT